MTGDGAEVWPTGCAWLSHRHRLAGHSYRLASSAERTQSGLVDLDRAGM